MKERHRKPWTYEEEQRLLEMVGESTIALMASRLHRSEEAIIRKLEKLGYTDLALASGAVRTYELADILQVDPTTVLRWIKEEKLPAKKFYKLSDQKHKANYHYIFPHEFWKWANKHRHLLNFAKIQRGVLLPEPKWLEEQIRHDRQYKAIRSQQYWTPEEDQKAWNWFYSGLTQEEIGKRLGRSKNAVQKRLAVLRKQRKKTITHEPVGLF